MAETAAPFDGGPNMEEDGWSTLWSQTLYNGVFDRAASTISGHQQNLELYTDADGRQVKVSPGEAHIHGKLYRNTETVTLALTPNTSGQTRIDRVVVRLNENASVSNGVGGKTAQLYVIQGTPAASPATPGLLTGAGGVWDIPIGTVSIANNYTTITSDKITRDRKWGDQWLGGRIMMSVNNGILFVTEDDQNAVRVALRNNLTGTDSDDLVFEGTTTANRVRFYFAGSQSMAIDGDEVNAYKPLIVNGNDNGLKIKKNGSVQIATIGPRTDLTGATEDDVSFKSAGSTNAFRFFVSSTQRFVVDNGFTAVVGYTRIGSGGLPGSTGSYIQIGTENSSRVQLLAQGDASTVNVMVRAKGTGSGIYFVSESGDEYWGAFDTTGDTAGGNSTSLMIRVDNATRRVQRGAADSGGTGFRMLRILN